ncbi:MAG: ABC transporter permease [bacterium]|nr:ABC transporter permease [bacterium]MDZ4248156.1 ABC transporter permease [Patescibacteria group bacterium]
MSARTGQWETRLGLGVRREFNRYWSIKRQTILTPILETYLYISVFGAALGSRVGNLEGFDYIVFILPGLVMMSFALNAFENNASSLFQQRFMRAIDDQLASPLHNLELLGAYALGGLGRGAIIGGTVLLTASFLVDLPIADPLLLVWCFFAIGGFFALFGVLMGVIADTFDQISLYRSFILQPLIFIGGVFYSTSLLPEPFQTASQFNPVFYMINAVRHGFLGTSDVDPYLSLGIVSAGVVVLFGIVYWIFKTGYKLRF